MNKIYLLIAISFISALSYGQTKKDPAKPVNPCYQQTLQDQRMKDPVLAAQFIEAQNQLKAREEAMSAMETVRGTVYKVPVVFHVLHQGGEENISDEQILDQLAILNRDFRLLNDDANNVHEDFQIGNPLATCVPTDVEVEFVMATKAPDGTCFTGITRTFSEMTLIGDHGEKYHAAAYGNDIYQGDWPSNKYLNIIIAKELGGAAGFTFLPGYNDYPGNCIYMLHNYLGSIGTSNVGGSRALTHEVGHWLNLSHIWGDGGIGECGDDHVDDTPETRGSALVCNLDENFCGPRANVENYMDYSYCCKMFSAGQVARMRAALTASVSGRNNLWSNANLALVGADGELALCAAKFSSDKTEICAGETITFSDESYNAVTGRTWSFPGGTPSTSTVADPAVTYNTPGVYAVTLSATDGSSSDTEEKTSYITVFGPGTGLPFYESFESLSAFHPQWFVSNTYGNGWELATNVGLSGTKSAKLNNFDQPADLIDELISHPVDLSGITPDEGVTLSFRYAYRMKTSESGDNLRVYLTNNCGDTWSLRKTLSATQMSESIEENSWTPAAADWVTAHVTNVSSQYWVDNFRFKFQFESGEGNNIYLDDINIYAGDPSNTIVLGLDNAADLQDAVLFPNPADEEVNIRFSSKSGQKVMVHITDLMGNILKEHTISASEGTNLVMLSTNDIASGMYMVRLNGGAQVLSFVVR